MARYMVDLIEHNQLNNPAFLNKKVRFGSFYLVVKKDRFEVIIHDKTFCIPIAKMREFVNTYGNRVQVSTGEPTGEPTKAHTSPSAYLKRAGEVFRKGYEEFKHGFSERKPKEALTGALEQFGFKRKKK
jgi:hypothetical protein